MSSFPPPTSAPAGWYPDPDGGVGRRYFDGRAWGPPPPRIADPEPHPDLPLGAALGALAVLTVSLVAAKLLLDRLVEREWPLIAYITISAVVSYVPSIGWGLFVRRRWGTGRLASLGWRFRWSDLGWGPLAWLVALASQSALAIVVLVFDVPFESNIETVGDADTDRAYLIAILVAAVIAAPVVEELVFRGLVLRGFLSRMHPVVAIVLQGILFGAAHVDPVRGAGNVGLAMVLAGVGVALGGAAYLTNRLGPGIIAHAILNAVALTIALTGAFDDVESPFDSAGFGGAGSAAELLVVDEADVAEPRRHEQHARPVDAGDGFERDRVDQLGVLQ